MVIPPGASRLSMICTAVSTAAGLPRYPTRMASKVIPFSCQWRQIPESCASKRTAAGFPKPPVWVDSSTVGRMQVSAPQADKMGSATVVEHCPTQEMS